MTRSRIAALALTAAGALTFVTACTGPSGTSAATSAGPSAAPSPTAAETPSGAAVQRRVEAVPASGGVVRLSAAKVGNLGTVLTDAGGHTLYRFDNDRAAPPTSNCVGACAAAWPPLLAQGPIEVSGIDQALVGTVLRKDGTTQVTVNNWPVYLFAKDSAPGDAKGQGMNGVWFAVTPLGKKAVAQGPATTNDNSYQGGYGY